MNKLFLYLVCLFLLSCNNSKGKKEDKKENKETEAKKEEQAIPGYDFANPEKFTMPGSLTEVSGITFYKGNNDTLYAEQDEEGRLYYLRLGDSKATHVKFGKKGDYEDMAIVSEQVIFLRSDGVLFSFPFNKVKQEEITDAKEWKGLLPTGEYEGMYADPSNNMIYVLCKQCMDDKTTKAVSAYMLHLEADGSITQKGSIVINVDDIAKMGGEKKLKFQPSALAKNPRTNEWYFLSSVNKLLVITDDTWKVKSVYHLDPALFRQPEGMTFDSENNLYISNEGDDISNGNVLKFGFKSK